jgi:hypothetical protein
VQEKGDWKPHEVEILARNPDEVAIKGIEAGTRVALVEPDAAVQGQSKGRVRARRFQARPRVNSDAEIGNRPGGRGRHRRIGRVGRVELYRTANQSGGSPVPTTAVKRGQRYFRGLRQRRAPGGNSKMITTPMVGGGETSLTSLRAPGELVRAGDVIATLDTTDQTFKLREAEADVAEAEQKVIQAKAQLEAKEEEDNYLLIKLAAT